MIDQVSCRFHHASGTTTGAESPAFATKGDQMFVSAAIALDAQEAVFEQAALQVIFELPTDELWQVAA